MNYNDFRFKAMVDYIDIRVTLQEPSLVSHMKKYTGLNWVKAKDPGPGSAATVFDLRIQDPKHYSDIEAVIQRLEKEKPFSFAPVVSCIEVSLDSYPHDLETPLRALAECVVNWTGQHQYPAGERRIYDDLARGMPFNRKSAIRAVLEGCIIGMGHKDNDHYQRAYYKTTYKAGKIHLPPEERRIRFENTHKGQTLPVTAFDDLRSFSFEKLARQGFSFHTRKEDHGNKAIESTDTSHTLTVGKLGPIPGIRERIRGRSTQAEASLNAKARQALRNLTQQWAK